MKHIVTSDFPVPVQPEHIDATKHFFDAFGHNETEVSAHYVVLLGQSKGNWHPFTLDEIEKLYQSKGYKGFSFNRLVEDNWIVQNGDYYFVTIEFIARCYGSSPAV